VTRGRLSTEIELDFVLSLRGTMKHGEWYNRYLKTKYWRELRAKVLERDGHQCVICKSTVIVQVDHKIYRGEGLEILEDLQTLCYKCHNKKSRYDLLAWKSLGQKKVSVGGGQVFEVLRRENGGTDRIRKEA